MAVFLNLLVGFIVLFIDIDANNAVLNNPFTVSSHKVLQEVFQLCSFFKVVWLFYVLCISTYILEFDSLFLYTCLLGI